MQAPARHWVCPNCPVEDRTAASVRNRWHRCRGAGVYAGLYAPLVPAGVRARVITRERDDYVGGERVRLHQGRPVMSVITERADGSNDTAVFVPSARIAGHAR